MHIDIQHLIDNCDRNNVNYIFPTIDIKDLAKMISAMGNMEGGYIVIGVYDDGIVLKVKGHSFNHINKEETLQYLDKFENFTIDETQIEGKRIQVVHVEPSLNLVTSQQTPYFFNDKDQLAVFTPKKVFISYNHLCSNLADIVENNLTSTYGNKISISRDSKNLGYKDDIDEFMKSIKEHDIIVSIISDSYLRSQACMFEIAELRRDEKYIDRLAFIVLDERDLPYFEDRIDSEKIIPKIYGDGKYDYLKFWVEKKRSKSALMDSLKDSFTSTVELNLEIKQIGRITDGIGAFLSTLNKLIGEDFTAMHQDDFVEIKNMIDDKQ